MQHQCQSRKETSFDVFLAPTIYKFEIGNICWKSVRFSSWSREYAIRLMNQALGIPEFYDDLDFQGVLSLAFDHQLSYYDSSYLALALQSKATLISYDKKLNKAANNLGLDTFFF